MERLLSALVIFGPPVGCIVILLLVFHMLRRHRIKGRPVLAYPDVTSGAVASAAAAAVNLRHDLELVGDKRLLPGDSSDEEIYRAYLMPFVPMSERRLKKLPLLLLIARRLGQVGSDEKIVAGMETVVREARRRSTNPTQR
jgi:hypothetical protein